MFPDFFFSGLSLWPRYMRKDILHIKLVILSRKNGDRCDRDEKGLSMRLGGSLISSRSPGSPSLGNPSVDHTLVAETSPIILVHAES